MDSFNIVNNETFLLFLKNQVKGVFDHDCFCNHNLASDTCMECIKEFIKHSTYKKYFNNLYTWFIKETLTQPINSQPINNTLELSTDFIKPIENKDQFLQQVKYFQPNNVINCFKSIHNYLTSEQVTYFCSSWLDGIFFACENLKFKTSITELTIFESLCLQGYLETLKWLYDYIESSFIEKNPIQSRSLFNTLCKQTLVKNKNHNITDILSWLFSTKIFNQVNIHFEKEIAFKHACCSGKLEVVKWLLNLTGNNKINIHVNKESFFRYACRCACRCFWSHNCSQDILNVIKLLLSLEGDRRIDVNAYGGEAFCYACHMGHLELITLLSSDQRTNIHIRNEYAFRQSCFRGNLGVVKLLLSLKEKKGNINVHAESEEAFRISCENGYLELVKLLLSLKEDQEVDVHVLDENAFRNACYNEHLEIVELLLNLKGNRKINVHIDNNEIIKMACNKKNQKLINLLQPCYTLDELDYFMSLSL